MKYFITKSNFLRVARKVKYDENEQDISEIYKEELNFLSKFEKMEILCARDFLIKAQDHFYKFRGAGFRPDTYHYVNESSRFAKYHIDEYCPGLNSILHDFDIPVEIRFKQGSEEIDTAKVEEFRNWFKQNDIKELFLNDQERFLNKMQVKFGISNRPHIPKEFEFSGGGAQGIKNLNLIEIENKIKVLLENDKEYKNSSEEKLKILVEHNYSNKTFLVTSKNYVDKPIKYNNTGISEEKVREILKEYYDKIKKPIIDLLIEYWIVKINPNLDFNKNILDQLEFKPCVLCCLNSNENGIAEL